MNLNTTTKHIVAALIAVVGVASAYAQWHQATHLGPMTMHYYDTPAERCYGRGAEAFDDRGEWPLTREGLEARTIVQAACDRDATIYGADEPGAIQH